MVTLVLSLGGGGHASEWQPDRAARHPGQPDRGPAGLRTICS